MPEEAETVISDPENSVFLSAVVVWEIRIKQSLGKLDLPDEFDEVLKNQPFTELPITIEHAHGIHRLRRVHRDPFDRLLVTQAMVEDLVMVSRDSAIAEYGVRVITA